MTTLKVHFLPRINHNIKGRARVSFLVSLNSVLLTGGASLSLSLSSPNRTSLCSLPSLLLLFPGRRWGVASSSSKSPAVHPLPPSLLGRASRRPVLLAPTLPVWRWMAVGGSGAKVSGDGTLDSLDDGALKSLDDDASYGRSGGRGSRRKKLGSHESRLDLGGCGWLRAMRRRVSGGSGRCGSRPAGGCGRCDPTHFDGGGGGATSAMGSC